MRMVGHQEGIEIPVCTIHPSLIRPILLAGADRTLVLINITCIMMLIFGAGIHWLTLIAALFFALIGHGILIRIAKYDPSFSKIYLRHIKYHDFYPCLGSSLSNVVIPL